MCHSIPLRYLKVFISETWWIWTVWTAINLTRLGFILPLWRVCCLTGSSVSKLWLMCQSFVRADIDLYASIKTHMATNGVSSLTLWHVSLWVLMKIDEQIPCYLAVCRHTEKCFRKNKPEFGFDARGAGNGFSMSLRKYVWPPLNIKQPCVFIRHRRRSFITYEKYTFLIISIWTSLKHDQFYWRLSRHFSDRMSLLISYWLISCCCCYLRIISLKCSKFLCIEQT